MITRAPLAALLLHLLPKKKRAPKISYTTNDSGRPLWKQSQTEHNDCLQLAIMIDRCMYAERERKSQLHHQSSSFRSIIPEADDFLAACGGFHGHCSSSNTALAWWLAPPSSAFHQNFCGQSRR